MENQPQTSVQAAAAGRTEPEKTGRQKENQRTKDSREGPCVDGERMLVYGLCIGSIVQWKAVPGINGAGHVQQGMLVIYADKSIHGEQVCDELEKIKTACGLPQRIKADNGPEFISRALDARAYFNKIKLDYSRPGTPADNSHIDPSAAVFGTNA